MTEREKFIVMSYTGVSMLDWDVFHEQVEKVMGRPVYTLEFAQDLFIDELKEKVKPMFIELCEETTGWTKIDPERMATWPGLNEEVLVTIWHDSLEVAWLSHDSYRNEVWDSDNFANEPFESVTAWMPLPEPYKEETS